MSAAPVSPEDESMLPVTYVCMTLMASACIWIGSHRSLEHGTRVAETMTDKDAYMFPLIGSCVLFGLYMCFKFFNKDYINMLLTAYFLFFGALAVQMVTAPVFLWLFPPKKSAKPWVWSPHFPWDEEATVLKFYGGDVVAAMLGLLVVIAYSLNKHWLLSNFLGLSFSIAGIAQVSLGSFKVGAIMLVGLFFYDIFWVFGTDVMVTVAKSFDAPIKLLFPRNILADQFEFSMLGLGDIVIPGIFIALLLRFDAERTGRRPRPTGGFPRPYFFICFASYVAGLATTMLVMHVFKAAQPALLYLVPYCLGAALLTGLVRGELAPLFAYTDEEEGDDQAATKKSSMKKDK